MTTCASTASSNSPQSPILILTLAPHRAWARVKIRFLKLVFRRPTKPIKATFSPDPRPSTPPIRYKKVYGIKKIKKIVIKNLMAFFLFLIWTTIFNNCIIWVNCTHLRKTFSAFERDSNNFSQVTTPIKIQQRKCAFFTGYWAILKHSGNNVTYSYSCWIFSIFLVRKVINWVMRRLLDSCLKCIWQIERNFIQILSTFF